MTAKQLVDCNVLCAQSEVVNELMSSNDRLLDSAINLGEYDEIMEWWLVSSYMARQLIEQGEVIVSDYGCHWWGRQTSGQAIYMDYVIQKITEGLV
jgi:hypothetical protein